MVQRKCIASTVVNMGDAKLNKFMNPSTDIIRTKPGLLEVALRGASVGLPLITVIAASSCQGRLGEFVGGLVAQTYSYSGLIISLSYAVMLYQVVAIAQLFLRVKLGYASVLRWSVFFLVDILATLFIACGYFYSSVVLSVNTVRWSHLASEDADAGRINNATGITTAFSYLALLLFLGTIVYFYVARCKFRWSTHGETDVQRLY